MKFSERIGKTAVRSTFQIGSMDDELKNQLWNCFLEVFIEILNKERVGDSKADLEAVFITIWKNYFKKPIDAIPAYDPYRNSPYSENMLGVIRKMFFTVEWYEVYNFLEYISDLNSTFKISDLFDGTCNYILKKELSGYRIIKGRVVQITTEQEINEIEEAMNVSSIWLPVEKHLSTALSLFADKKHPDFRNSVKESISAVEAFCIIITNNKSATLGSALIEIEKKHALPTALKKSFSALYGYTSDSSGIRHALINTDKPVDMEEAKFMLVSCSAFINFLRSKVL